MANLTGIKDAPTHARDFYIGSVQPIGLRFMGGGRPVVYYRVEQDLETGIIDPPSAKFYGGHKMRMLWSVVEGVNTFTIRTQYFPDVPGANPMIRVHAKPEIGIDEDIVVEAESGEGWVEVTAVATITAPGLVEITAFRFELPTTTEERTGQYTRWDQAESEVG